MAMLLAMFQKMRLIREKNQATLDLTKFSSKYDRVQKNIERLQKMYTSRLSKLESQAKQMQSMASVFFQQQSQLDVNSVNTNMYSYLGGSCLSAYVLGNMQALLTGKDSTLKIAGEDGKPVKYPGMDETKYQQMVTAYQTYGKQGLMYKIGDNGPVLKEGSDSEYVASGFSAADQAAFMTALQMANASQSQAQINLQNMNQNYQNNVSIWLEAAKAQIEAEQDAALEPLNYQETMWELEKNLADQRLKRINAELESYDSLLSEETKNSTPSFGLR